MKHVTANFHTLTFNYKRRHEHWTVYGIGNDVNL